MKKSFMFFILSLTIVGTAQAGLKSDYENALDEWQKAYPVIQKLRTEELFIECSGTFLKKFKKNTDATPELVFENVIKNIIPIFYQNYDKYCLYVERLAPIYEFFVHFKFNE